MTGNSFCYIVIVKGKEVGVMKTEHLFIEEMYSISTEEPVINSNDEEVVPYIIYTYGKKRSILHNGWKLECNGTITIGLNNVFRIETIVMNPFNVRMAINERILYEDLTGGFIVEDLFEAIFKKFYSISSTGNGRFDHLCLKKEQFCTKWKHILDSGTRIDKKMYEQCSKESKKIDRIHERYGKLPQLIGNQKEYYRYLIKASVKTLFQMACKLSENYPYAFKKTNKKTLKKK